MDFIIIALVSILIQARMHAADMATANSTTVASAHNSFAKGSPDGNLRLRRIVCLTRQLVSDYR